MDDFSARVKQFERDTVDYIQKSQKRSCMGLKSNLYELLLHGDLLKLLQDFDKDIREVGDPKEVIKSMRQLEELIAPQEEKNNGLEGTAMKKPCFGWCSKQTSKGAEKCRQEDVIELLKEIRRTHEEALSKKEQEVASVGNDFMNFESREGVIKDIMEALQSTSINSIGVYGMAGVGKTMLVEQIKRKAEQLKLFDDVVMAKVTNNPDCRRIQHQIARDLDLELPDSVTAADRIMSRLTNGKVLVILDDIWARKDLEKVGIPFGNKHGQKLKLPTEKKNEEISSVEEQTECILLMTSRDPDVLSLDMDAQKIIEVHQLKENEPWDFFKKIAGEPAKNHIFQRAEKKDEKIEGEQPIKEVKKIVEGCNQLPIAIATVASTLENKNLIQWRTTIKKLLSYQEGPKLEENLSGMSPSLCLAIKLRYGDLESKQLKQTLLLCSLMGHNAGLHDLLKNGIGLGLFPAEANSIEAARHEAEISVKKLRDSSFLLGGGSNMYFDMHDPIREVAISIASGEHEVLALREDAAKGKLDREELQKSEWIYLSNVDADQLPKKLKCPQLTFFHLANKILHLEIPDDFFKEAEKLRVLSLTGMHFSSSPSSISLPVNLHTFRLEQSKLGTKLCSIIGSLKNVQVLSLVGCDIEELPQGTKELGKLKLLDLSDCTKLKVIPSDVLKSLSQLEELYLGNSFDQWEGIQEHENRGNASLDELTQLGNLTSLEVRILDIEMIPDSLFTIELKRYKIFVGDVWNRWDSSFEHCKILKLKPDGSSSFDKIKKLLNKVEELHLEKLNGAKDVVNELDKSGFQELKFLHVKNDPEIQHMFFNSESGVKVFPELEVLFLHSVMKLEKIFHGHFEPTSFEKLRIITVIDCNQLKILFPLSIAIKLHLQEIRVTNCSNIVEIVDDEDDKEKQGTNEITNEATDHLIKLASQIHCLRLQHLPQFISFSQEKVIRSRRTLFNEKLVGRHRRWNLTRMIIEGCDELESLFSLSIVGCLEKLKHLEIRACKKMTEIIVTEEDAGKKVNSIWFSELNSLQMEDLQNLIRFCSGNHTIHFPSLKHLAIDSCTELKGFVVDSTSTDITALFDNKVSFSTLERLTLTQLKTLNIIWHKVLEISLSNLNFLHIEDLQHLIGLCSDDSCSEFPSLKQLAIKNCPELKGFVVSMNKDNTALFDEKVAFPKLERMTISHLNNWKTICKQLDQNSFCNLKSLRVTYCQNLSAIFPSNNDMLRKLLESLEKLEIIGCNSIEEVFELGLSEITEMPAAIPSKLKELYIHQLPRLKHVWGKDRQGIATFQNLESVKVFNCPGLSHMFPYSLATSLSQLKRLQIQDCTELEEIIAMEPEVKEDVKFVFRSLSCLVLHSLPKLKCFYPGKHTTHWPDLKKFYSYGCGRGKITNEQGEPEFSVELPLFYMEKVKPELKKLSLTDDHIRIISKDQYFTAGLLNHIEVLQIQCYDDESAVLPIDFIKKFHHLKKLSVEFCHFKRLFPSKSIQEYSSIRRLKLNSLPYLRCLWDQDSSVPQNLETLRLWDCESLISLSTSTASFQTLTNLDVWNCQEMLNLVSFSTAESLVRLKSLSIRECHRVTEIVGSTGDATRNEIAFKELIYLRLECLTKLASFCSGNCTLRFPSVERVIVNHCPNMKTFCHGVLEMPILLRGLTLKRKDKWISAGYLNATIQKLYEEKNLKLSPELIGKWNTNPQEFFRFRQLTSLEIYNVSNMTYLLTPSMAMELVELMKLDVKNCEMMEHIITEGAEEVQENKLIFHQLKSIKSCSKLASFSTGSYTLKFPSLIDVNIHDCPDIFIFPSTFSRDQGQKASEPFFSTKVEFSNLSLKLSSVLLENQLPAMFPSVQNLTELVVESCGGLKYLMTFSMVKSFSQLKKLVIIGCKKMEIVIKGFTEENGILFPRLERMELKDLPELARFYTANKVDFPKLEFLRLSSVNIEQIWHNQLSALFPIVQNLTELVVEDSGGMKYLMTPSMVQSFLQLKKLVIRGCKKMEEVIETKGLAEINRNSSMPFFPKLDSMELEDLPELTRFCFESQAPSATTFELPQVTNLKFSKLPKLKSFLPHQRHWNQDSSVPQNLEILEVRDCESLISLSMSTASFQTLATLDVWSCQEMLNLVLSSTVESLVQLKSLSIRECHRVEEVVGKDGDATKKEINFKELTYLRLECLTKLTSFCSGNFTFKFPSLERVIVNQCPNMKTFCHGVLETPRLRVQALKRKDKWVSGRYLNAAIQKLNEEKNLKLSEFPEPIENWNTNIQEFRQLTSLEICNISNLPFLLNPSMATELVELMQLTVKNCEMMEQIIRGGDENVQGNELIFHQLKVITLESCSKLTSFSTGSHTLNFPSLIDVTITECPNMVIFASTFSRVQQQEAHEPFFSTKVDKFSNRESLRCSSDNIQQMRPNQVPAMYSVQNLTELVVAGCGSFRYLMEFSMVQSLSLLKKLVIRGCKIEEVIVTENSTQKRVSLFPKLNTMELEDLSELTRFCSESQADTIFVFPQVTKLKFSKLPKLKSFLPRNATEWPSLTNICVHNCDQVQIFALEFSREDYQHPLFWVNEVALNLCNEEPFSSNLPSQAQEGSRSNTAVPFVNLRNLEVSSCGGLVTLLRCGIAKRLEHLSKLSITDCSKLKNVVAGGGDKVKDELVFTQLESLQLGRLKRLESFCSGKCNLKLPCLKEVTLTRCPEMRIFSEGEVKAETLQKVGHEDVKDGNLNDTIKRLQRKMRIAALVEGVPAIIILHPVFLYFWNHVMNPIRRWFMGNRVAMVVILLPLFLYFWNHGMNPIRRWFMRNRESRPKESGESESAPKESGELESAPKESGESESGSKESRESESGSGCKESGESKSESESGSGSGSKESGESKSESESESGSRSKESGQGEESGPIRT